MPKSPIRVLNCGGRYETQILHGDVRFSGGYSDSDIRSSTIYYLVSDGKPVLDKHGHYVVDQERTAVARRGLGRRYKGKYRKGW